MWLGSLMLCMAFIFVMPGVSADAAKMSLSKKSVSIYKGKTYKLTLKNAVKGKKITWKTSKKSVAAIKANGAACTITAKKAGSATVSAKVGKKTYKCKVQVKNPPVSISAKKKTITAGTSFTLQLNNAASNAKWSVSSKKVLSIKKLGKNKYKVSGLKKGSAKVYAKIGRKKYTCAVTVKAKTAAVKKAPSCVARQTVYGYDNDYYFNEKRPFFLQNLVTTSNLIFIKNLDKNAKVIDIKSSNEYLFAEKSRYMDAIVLNCKYYDFTDGTSVRPSILDQTSKISFKVIQNGKTYNLSCLVTLKKAESPFDKFVVGDTDYAKYFNGYNRLVKELSSMGTGKLKVNVKMAKGYILDSIDLIDMSAAGNIVTVKNGSQIRLKEDMGISVYYHTTKLLPNYKQPSLTTMVPPLYDSRYISVY